MANRPPDWTDPDYVAAKHKRAEAYAEFCRVAGANPHTYGQDGFFHYYLEVTMPAKIVFVKAHKAYQAQTDRVLATVGREHAARARNQT